MTEILTVFGLGAFELWAAIPAGFVLKLHPFTTAIVAAIGAFVGASLVLILGERMRIWLLRRRADRNEEVKTRRIHQIWQRYGVVGLGLLAPLLTGAPLGVAVGLLFGAPASRLLFWISIGIAIWTTILTLIGVLGIAGIEWLT
jgi:membrane protein DedA with SNARE-associated domain